MNLDTEDYDNLYEISQEIFLSPVKPKKTIVLDLEDSCKNEKSLFDILLLLAKNGIYLLFNKYDPLDLTQSEFNLLNLYFHSFGFKIEFSAESLDDIEFLIERPDQLKSLLDAGYNFCNYKIEFKFL
jgi:hypothetical protein